MNDLTTAEGTLAYLQSTPYAASDVQRLSGGQSAFTYQITLKAPIHTSEKKILGAEQGEFEYKALMAVEVSNLFNSNGTVQTPRPIHFDPETHTIFVTDLAPTVGLAHALTDSPGMMTEIGEALGDFMGRFHNWGAAPEQAELRDAC